MKACCVLVTTIFDLCLYLNAITVSLVLGFFFKNSSTLRYLGVLEGQKLSFPVEKQHLGLICLVGFFTFVECTEHVQRYIFNSMNCEC